VLAVATIKPVAAVQNTSSIFSEQRDILMSTKTDVWTDVHHERQALLELLETLTPEQWDTPSLCAEWRVRDVVGHMVSETRMTVAQAAGGFIASDFRINRYIAKDGRQRGAAPVAKLLEDFRGAIPVRTHLPGLSSLSMLEDIVIHQMDIRLPLERDRCIPKERMIPVAGDLWTKRFFPGPKLFQGIRAIATDADWSAGNGLDVTGPIEALVLTLAGRFAALDDLHGDGASTLRQRIARIVRVPELRSEKLTAHISRLERCLSPGLERSPAYPRNPSHADPEPVKQFETRSYEASFAISST
jgi:uncharacterized protein (TIGR03083 family)